MPVDQNSQPAYGEQCSAISAHMGKLRLKGTVFPFNDLKDEEEVNAIVDDGAGEGKEQTTGTQAFRLPVIPEKRSIAIANLILVHVFTRGFHSTAAMFPSLLRFPHLSYHLSYSKKCRR